ncbi:GDSL-type esterase/lipase family protein [Streptomyces sp. NBC_00038]|uniref:GDSL-type esterase/lipase family protein n=1 Tax=Streptomyces sp. NBC_00038 TaxID=2903615 RepID=UPI00225359E6|nr:GDSL-type esterase/lipase family protein [Streptomyces sp. NBC_00038]MCX5556887.1 GDSL-type esterase/lipase family protein [Streptomyces sp. NBC_00038]
MTTAWIAAYRSALVSPHETLHVLEPRGFADQTVRQALRLAGGGEAFRVRLSNRYGRRPLEIARAHIAERTEGPGIAPATDTALLFEGAARITVPVGEEIVSDMVERAVHAGEELVVSLHLPGDTGLTTYSAVPYDIGYAAPGDQCRAEVLKDTEELTTGHFIAGVDVLAPRDTRIAVAFGDSWLEGAFTTPGTDSSFPAQLSRRLARGWIVNHGISGNRLLTDEIGDHLLARVGHDVLDVPGVSHVLIHIGLNDLGQPGFVAHPEPGTLPTTDEFIAGLTVLADRLHTAGLTVIGSTIGPYRGTVYEGYDSETGQTVRGEVNAWLRGGDHPFDAITDIAAAVADPDRADRIREEFNAGDGLHINDAGAKAVADAFDVSLLNL